MSDKPTGLSHGLARHEDPNLNRCYVKSSGEVATMVERLGMRVKSGTLRSLRFGLAGLDKRVRTLWPGTVTVVLGRPSNRKSSTLKHMARLECERIQAEGRNEVVLYATLEESEEEVALRIASAGFGVADVIEGTVTDLVTAADKVAGLPLSVIGFHRTDIMRAATERPPRLTIEQVYREVEQRIEDDGRQCSALFLDYIQKAATEARGEREQAARVAFIVGQLVDLVKRLDVPAVVAAQARRDVDDRFPPIPQMGDGQWSSQLEQDADVVLACWYPFKSELDVRERIRREFNLRQFPTESACLDAATLLDPRTMILSLRKQRLGEGSGLWAVKVDPASGALSDWPQPRVTIGGHDVEL